MEIAIIGGGAAGLAAAVAAADEGAGVTVYERMPRVGKKILATGNGRCNYSNLFVSPKHYYGEDRSFTEPVLSHFGEKQAEDFFLSLGMMTRIEEGQRAYPITMQSSAVLDVLRLALSDRKVVIKTDFEVKSVKKIKSGFLIISYTGEEAFSDKVIIAAGGKAQASLGSNGSGYDIAKGLGHTVTRVFPALVQIRTENGLVKSLKGIRIEADVSYIGKNGQFSSSGEVLFCDYGLSGPAIFDISRHAAETGDGKIILDLLPGIDIKGTERIISERKEKERTLEELFIGILNKKLGIAVMKYANVLPLSRPAKSLKDEEIKRLSEAVKGFELKVCGTMSWNNAQVTAGGVRVSEIDRHTMESLKTKGVYFAGEVMDVDGDCGGYNLHWAWASGITAGRSAAGGERYKDV